MIGGWELQGKPASAQHRGRFKGTVPRVCLGGDAGSWRCGRGLARGPKPRDQGEESPQGLRWGVPLPWIAHSQPPRPEEGSASPAGRSSCNVASVAWRKSWRDTPEQSAFLRDPERVRRAWGGPRVPLVFWVEGDHPLSLPPISAVPSLIQSTNLCRAPGLSAENSAMPGVTSALL